MRAVGVVFSNIHDKYVPEFTRTRTMASIPFGGRYRLIDFALSNMVNSGIYKVGVITRNNYQSLMDHLESGKSWDLSRKDGGLIVLPPYGVSDTTLYSSRLEALKNITTFLNRCKEEYVIMTDCNCVCNIDYRKVMEFHESKGADVTLVCKKMLVGDISMSGVNVVKTDENDRITECKFAGKSGFDNVFINMLVIKKSFLQNMVADATSMGLTSMMKDIITPGLKSMHVYCYEFEGYYACIDSLMHYFSRNMDMLDRKVRDSLFNDKNRSIYTKLKDSAPSKYGNEAVINNSMIADGCEIYGTVENSILFRNVKVEKGAVVKNSIIMQNGSVYNNANLNCVIMDKNVVIKKGRCLSGCEVQPFYITKNSII